MDQTDQHNLQSPQFISSQLYKKITHVLLSLSVVFSFFLSNSSWYTLFLHSFNFHFSTFPFQLLTHTMDKNCIFLICNGIVMLLAKTSGLIHSSPASNHLNNQLLKKIGDGDVLQLSLETKDSLLEKQVSVETLQQQQEEEDSMEGESEEDLNVEGQEQEARNGFLITVGGEDEENEKDLSTVNNGFAIEEEEEEEEEEDGLLSREELNKKCDDFIRRMKEEIRIGAQQQQLVMA
ncbi:hypothetical protein LOK49_LG07G03513 [Camellia lanceoleosa]|uniref:Uncharacterized protein n=1 Tax=Camellia lanceoleosa TaxID=1840588 RepID=A0ACC0H6W9_9ERIC|nr:hypothetical protein LOK49_LG07G03513 [Camellia lanceoleosa]